MIEHSLLSPEHIELTIIVEARYQGERITGPCLVKETVALMVPYAVDPKFINLGKLMEGVIPEVVGEHKRKVGAEAAKKEDRKQLRLWDGNNGNGRHEEPVEETA